MKLMIEDYCNYPTQSPLRNAKQHTRRLKFPDDDWPKHLSMTITKVDFG